MDEVNKELFRYSPDIVKTNPFFFADWMLKNLDYTDNFFMLSNFLKDFKV